MSSKIIFKKVSNVSMILQRKFTKTSYLTRWEDFILKCHEHVSLHLVFWVMTIALLMFWKIAQSCLFY